MSDKKQERSEVKSFETADGDVFGDLLSTDRIDSNKPLKIGLLWTGFFEFWHMYPNLKEQVIGDAKVVYERLSKKHDIVQTEMVDTIDAADKAGRMFRDEQVDMVILAYRTYVPDMYMHQMLAHLPDEIPLLIFGSQSRGKLEYTDDYGGVLRNSGFMALIQLVCGFKKIDGNKRSIEAVAGDIYDDEAYEKIDRYIDVVTIFKRLKTMTFGVIGNVFRGMFDFEYDKTKVKGRLGPEVMNIQVDHLANQLDETSRDDPDVLAVIKHARDSYTIDGVGDDDLVRASQVAVALKRLVKRFRIDGLALLAQHTVEKKLKTTPYLGMALLHSEGFPCAQEGDVIGCITMKILHHFTGNMPFFVEWSEMDIELNAWMLLAHGFGDPTQARNGEVKLTPTAEMWGQEGTGCSTEFVPIPGVCTIAHFVHQGDGWKMVLTGGEILDVEPLPIRDMHVMVRTNIPIKEHGERLLKAGVPHHGITVRGDVRKEMLQLAELMRMDVIEI